MTIGSGCRVPSAHLMLRAIMERYQVSGGVEGHAADRSAWDKREATRADAEGLQAKGVCLDLRNVRDANHERNARIAAAGVESRPLT